MAPHEFPGTITHSADAGLRGNLTGKPCQQKRSGSLSQGELGPVQRSGEKQVIDYHHSDGDTCSPGSPPLRPQS